MVSPNLVVKDSGIRNSFFCKKYLIVMFNSFRVVEMILIPRVSPGAIDIKAFQALGHTEWNFHE